MDTIIIVVLVIVILVLVYFVVHGDGNTSIVPSPNTFSNSLPTTTMAAEAETETVVLQPVEILAPGYPLDEQYYYDPAYFYDPYWWWGGWGSWDGRYRRPHHSGHHNGHHNMRLRYPSSGDVVHGGIQPRNMRMGGSRGRHH